LGFGQQFHAGSVCQQAQRFGEIQILHFLKKGKDVAAGGTRAEAVPILAFREDDERRGFFAMEGTQALVIAPGLLQRDIPRDHFDYIESLLNFVDDAHTPRWMSM